MISAGLRDLSENIRPLWVALAHYDVETIYMGNSEHRAKRLDLSCAVFATMSQADRAKTEQFRDELLNQRGFRNGIRIANDA